MTTSQAPVGPLWTKEFGRWPWGSPGSDSGNMAGPGIQTYNKKYPTHVYRKLSTDNKFRINAKKWFLISILFIHEIKK